MIVTATGFIPFSPRSIVSAMVMWESSQWLGKNIVWSIGKRNIREACMHWPPRYNWNNFENGVKDHTINQFVTIVVS